MLFVLRFGQEDVPSFNAVYYDFGTHTWRFADGGGSYHREWPTHYMLAEDAAPMPKVALDNGQGSRPEPDQGGSQS